MTTTRDTPVLDPDAAQRLQRRHSMFAAGRDARKVPTSARVYGCRVAPDAGTITVFVHRAQAARLLLDVAENRQIAVVFSRPTTHYTVQLKGVDARVDPLAPGDAQVIAEWVGSFVVELAELGFDAPFVHTACSFAPDEMAAISFTPSDGFAQTPGPGAGARLARTGQQERRDARVE